MHPSFPVHLLISFFCTSQCPSNPTQLRTGPSIWTSGGTMGSCPHEIARTLHTTGERYDCLNAVQSKPEGNRETAGGTKPRLATSIKFNWYLPVVFPQLYITHGHHGRDELICLQQEYVKQVEWFTVFMLPSPRVYWCLLDQRFLTWIVMYWVVAVHWLWNLMEFANFGPETSSEC